MTRARYIMLGGFLGAGKTTALMRLAEHLEARGLRVGLITNDQSVGLVDTALLTARGHAVAEITGGCFCCRFDSLVAAAAELSEEQRPDVFLAEPVGSCTDLRASVSLPLRELYGEHYLVAPLSVLVDPRRARRVFGLDQGRGFSEKVRYVYEKQLEEADLIVINKRETLSAEAFGELRSELARRFPDAEILEASARESEGLEPWFERLLNEPLGVTGDLELDYELYAEGEARLGWLNARIDLRSTTPLDGNALLEELAVLVARGLSEAGREIAHFKMSLSPSELPQDLAVLNLVLGDARGELSHRLDAPLERGLLTVNLRAEAEPEEARGRFGESLKALVKEHPGLTLETLQLETFAPPPPVPTHRLSETIRSENR